MEGILPKTEKLLSDYLAGVGCSAAIKVLDKYLCQNGDVVVKSKTDSKIRFDCEALIAASKSWPLPIERITCDENASYIWFVRADAFLRALKAMEWKPVRATGASFSENLYIEEPTADSLESISMTQYRADVLRKIFKNCFTHAGYAVVEKAQLDDKKMFGEVKEIKLVQKLSKPPAENHAEVLYGPVLTGAHPANAAQYIELRSNEMQLIAQHRYGLRIPDRARQEQLVASLGRSVAIVDLLHTKQTCAIDFRPPQSINRTQSSSKEAAFMLYNYARLQAIFKKHAALMEQEGVQDIPPLEEINFALLIEPDEWQLLYAFILRFPKALSQTIGFGQHQYIAPHFLLSFTNDLVKCLSKYYSRTRILTENRPKLQPVMFARLHLLRAVSDLLKTLLHLLDLEPVEEM